MLTPDEIRAVQFSCVRLRAGYDQREVDEFLDALDSQLTARLAQLEAAAGPGHPEPLVVTLTGAEVLARTFSTARLRQCYERSEVDEFVRRAAQSLDELDTNLRRRGVQVRLDRT